MAAGPPQRPLRVVLFPWLAFGHLLPHLELAERLASRGHRATLVSTPGNVARLPPALGVDFVALPLPRVDGLPDGAESTNSIPHDKHSVLFQAFDGLAAPFAEFLAAACADERQRPDWIIVDIFHHWAAAAALEHKVPLAVYLPAAAALVRNPAAVVPRFESEQGNKQYNSDHGGMSMSQRFFSTLERCTLAALRSCVEWEPEFFPQVAPRLRKPVVPLGLLPPSPRANGAEDAVTVRWLDVQPPSSVVYVALGSEAPLPVEQVHELALGLELAGTRFLWALRKPSGVPDDGDLLPPGFQERTQGQGLVTTGWVPQVNILGHGAVGAFLTHCGQSSFVEGLLFGRPLVLLPIFGDQGSNARLLEGKKVGLQVARDEDDGSFDRHAVASAVRAVMVEEETRGVYVANALKAQEIVANKELHERYIDEFVQQLRSHTADANSTAAVPPQAEA
ncbi:hypothetical protein SEVIR_9G161300v4 [Setaria viridis]|uniref:Glycosyltransferase n=2 Tax=Setaria TaxID=4554 RepID=K4A9W5_SETIT|nr:UDP-glycosyltransferase 91C1 [Setaria italica]XP_034570923.1 UDP-glycosyltransferase 91C1-like [Setaria viridis]RCV41786.1 hypothetical protein SETIT_9G163100v2 [Setaria italica]TKV92405.1 hypothetical protein SEVIR_9G161300v2 [Setaria viridis]